MVTIGVAFNAGKEGRVLTKELLRLAETNQLKLVLIDPDQSLELQGPFYAIIHKMRRDPAWDERLLAYSAQFPSTLIVDPPKAIARVNDRALMFETFPREGLLVQWLGKRYTFRAPRQLYLRQLSAVEDLQQAAESEGLSPPLLVKTSTGHEMLVVHSWEDLVPAISKVQETSDHLESAWNPVVLQEYIPHSSQLHKVYVMGGASFVVRRPTLTSEQLSVLAEDSKSWEQLLDRISHASAGPGSNPDDLDLAVWQEVSAVLRNCLGLSLFNYDVVVADAGAGGADVRCYIVDINYFPGVQKVPNYEHEFMQFLVSLLPDRGRRDDKDLYMTARKTDPVPVLV